MADITSLLIAEYVCRLPAKCVPVSYSSVYMRFASHSAMPPIIICSLVPNHRPQSADSRLRVTQQACHTVPVTKARSASVTIDEMFTLGSALVGGHHHTSTCEMDLLWMYAR